MILHEFDGCELCIRTLADRHDAMQPEPVDPDDDELSDEAEQKDYENGWPPKA